MNRSIKAICESSEYHNAPEWTRSPFSWRGRVGATNGHLILLVDYVPVVHGEMPKATPPDGARAEFERQDFDVPLIETTAEDLRDWAYDNELCQMVCGCVGGCEAVVESEQREKPFALGHATGALVFDTRYIGTVARAGGPAERVAVAMTQEGNISAVLFRAETWEARVMPMRVRWSHEPMVRL